MLPQDVKLWQDKFVKKEKCKILNKCLNYIFNGTVMFIFSNKLVVKRMHTCNNNKNGFMTTQHISSS